MYYDKGGDDGVDGVNKVADVQWSHLGLSVHATLPSPSLCERDTKSTGLYVGGDIFTQPCLIIILNYFGQPSMQKNYAELNADSELKDQKKKKLNKSKTFQFKCLVFI